MVTFDTTYVEEGNYALSKAFDDRVGCSIMLDIIDYIYENNYNQHLIPISTLQLKKKLD
jgi:Cellulase M and related proteins